MPEGFSKPGVEDMVVRRSFKETGQLFSIAFQQCYAQIYMISTSKSS